MSEKIIFATGNAGKLKEIREILKDLNREIVTMREAGFEGEIEENGTTFRENAEIKAKAVWEKTGGIVLADDSGLVIDYLNGEPGVYSARYLGDTPYEEKNRILIERVKDAKGKERSARFMCNIAAVLPVVCIKSRMQPFLPSLKFLSGYIRNSSYTYRCLSTPGAL